MRNTLIKLSIILLIVLSVSACKSRRSFTTNTTKYEDDKIERLFIYIHLSKNEKYANELKEVFEQQFQDLNIPTKSYVRKELDLTNNTDLEQMAFDFDASHTLVMRQLSKEEFGDSKRSVYYFYLINMESSNAIWETMLDQNIKLIKRSNQMEDDVHLILENLKENNLY